MFPPLIMIPGQTGQGDETSRRLLTPDLFFSIQGTAKR
jgi:hypothetical protein